MAEFETAIETEETIEITKPSSYSVILHDDDVTTFEYVISILIHIFNKSHDDSERIAFNIHNDGKGIAGTYMKDVALAKKGECDYMNTVTSNSLKVSVQQNE